MFELASVPQEMGEIVLQGIRLGRLAFRRLFMLTSILAFLGMVPTAFLVWGAGDVPVTNDFILHNLIGPYGFIGLLMALVGLYVRAVLLKRISQAARGQTDGLEVELRQALRILPWMLAAAIVYILVVCFGLVLLIVPGLILALSLMFEEFGIVLDGLGPLQALNASHNLVWGQWWRTFGLLALMFLPLAVLLAIAAAMLSIDLGSVNDAATHGRDLFEQTVLEMVFLAGFGPFVYSILFLYYHDLKLRKQMLS